MSTPIRRARSGFCARETNGHATVPQPTSVMNSRRRMCTPTNTLVQWIESNTWDGTAGRKSQSTTLKPDQAQGPRWDQSHRFEPVRLTSVYPQKNMRPVRSISKRCQQLFDNLVGSGEERWRHSEAECLRGLQVDHQLEFGRLQDRQIAWLGTFENAASIDADLAKHIGDTWSVACQASGGRKVAVFVNRGYRVTRRQCNELLAPADEQR